MANFARRQIGDLAWEEHLKKKPAKTGKKTKQSVKRTERTDRRSLGGADTSLKDVRTEFKRDRDRILYSEYFQRLAGVTQVASAAEGGVFHNRLTHSLKVAQVGRRLAESLLNRYQARHPDLPDLLDPEVVEAACLGHDLGHPPFGHVADHRLCELAEQHGLDDGFEGNAQTFRIISRLATRRDHRGLGLDLTRATLAALAKYPWERSKKNTSGAKNKKRRKKFSFYADDREAAEFVLAGLSEGDRSLECAVMDLADSITYSVHDLEDFYRAGLIPIERLLRNKQYRRSFLDRWKADEPDKESQIYAQPDDVWDMDDGAFGGLLYMLVADGAEPGSRRELMLMDGFRSAAITQYLNGITLEADKDNFIVKMKEELEHQCRLMQRLIWHYVILTPRLATQQAGQIKIIDDLFEYFRNSLAGKQPRLDRIPNRFREQAEEAANIAKEQHADDEHPACCIRLAIDIVASLTEAEAIVLHRKISGYNGGSVLDVINR